MTRTRVVTLLSALIISTTLLIGAYLSFEYMESTPRLALVFGFAIILAGTFFLLTALWKLLDSLPPITRAGAKAPSTLVLICCGCFVFACWFVILLAGFPGFCNYDAIAQWEQYSAGVYTTYQPVIHTLFLCSTISLGESLFGSFQMGIFLTVLIQAILITVILTWSLFALARLGMGCKGILISTAFYALNPIIGMFALSTTKDSLCSALMLVYVLEIAQMLKNDTGDARRIFLSIVPVVLLVCLLRLNAAPALALSTICIAVLLRKNQCGRLIALASGVAIALSLVVYGPVYSLVGIGSSTNQGWNVLAVPTQQVARCYGSTSTSAEDKDRIRDTIGDVNYRRNLSDIARSGIVKTDCTKQEFLELYFDLGFKYPRTYLEAALLHTEDAWSPFSTIDAYRRPASKIYDSVSNPTSVFEFALKDFDDAHTADFESKIPPLKDFLIWLSTSPDASKMPFIRLIVSIWPFVLLLLLCLARCIIKRSRIDLCVLLPLATLFLTNLIGPCMIIRYFYYLMLAVPLMVLILLQQKRAMHS